MWGVRAAPQALRSCGVLALPVGWAGVCSGGTIRTRAPGQRAAVGNLALNRRLHRRRHDALSTVRSWALARRRRAPLCCRRLREGRAPARGRRAADALRRRLAFAGRLHGGPSRLRGDHAVVCFPTSLTDAALRPLPRASGARARPGGRIGRLDRRCRRVSRPTLRVPTAPNWPNTTDHFRRRRATRSARFPCTTVPEP